jgi:hypothetical protein
MVDTVDFLGAQERLTPLQGRLSPLQERLSRLQVERLYLSSLIKSFSQPALKRKASQFCLLKAMVCLQKKI